MNQTIVDAIRNKQCLSFRYDGFTRVVEPHAYGLSRKEEEVIRAYQISGGHASDHNEPWHLFRVAKATGIKSTEDTFGGQRPGCQRGDGHIPEIFAEL